MCIRDRPFAGQGFGVGRIALFGLWPGGRDHLADALDLVVRLDFVFRDGLDRRVDSAAPAAVVVS